MHISHFTTEACCIHLFHDCYNAKKSMCCTLYIEKWVIYLKFPNYNNKFCSLVDAINCSGLGTSKSVIKHNSFGFDFRFPWEANTRAECQLCKGTDVREPFDLWIRIKLKKIKNRDQFLIWLIVCVVSCISRCVKLLFFMIILNIWYNCKPLNWIYVRLMFEFTIMPRSNKSSRNKVLIGILLFCM